ncbi:hypothetical protein Sm713_81060 [Streptomyces sp. TS71-3]|nr:hypothetical protein Sm713_81060 [Streptomyces sp. TS71-3]
MLGDWAHPAPHHPPWPGFPHRNGLFHQVPGPLTSVARQKVSDTYTGPPWAFPLFGRGLPGPPGEPGAPVPGGLDGTFRAAAEGNPVLMARIASMGTSGRA